TACRLRPSRPTDKWQHRLSSRTPIGTELASRQLIQSANINTVESNGTKSNNKSKSPMKEKEQTLDTSDLLIECRLIVTNRLCRCLPQCSSHQSGFSTLLHPCNQFEREQSIRTNSLPRIDDMHLCRTWAKVSPTYLFAKEILLLFPLTNLASYQGSGTKSCPLSTCLGRDSSTENC